MLCCDLLAQHSIWGAALPTGQGRVPGLWDWDRASPRHSTGSETQLMYREVKGRHPRWQQRRQQLCAPPRSHSLPPQSLCQQPSVCPEAVSLSLFNLQLFWKAKFHGSVVFSHLPPSLHTYLPTSLHIDLHTHFSFFPMLSQMVRFIPLW